MDVSDQHKRRWVEPCATEHECNQPEVCRQTGGCERVEDAEPWRYTHPPGTKGIKQVPKDAASLNKEKQG